MVLVDGLAKIDIDRYILVVTHHNYDDINNPYFQYCFDGGPELEDFYNRHSGRNLNCTPKDLAMVMILTEKGLPAIEALSRLIT